MSKKISVDLTDENAGALYQNKEVHGLGYGPTINMLIRIFFRSPDIRDDLIEICKSKIQSGNLVYLDMLQFLTYDTQLTLDAVLDGVRIMKKINRRIFQPNQLTDIMLNEACDKNKANLSDFINDVDPDYPLGTREFGERSKYIFAHWSELYQYSEIYIALATIIECEKVYYPLDAFTTISLIKQLDRAIMESSNIAPVKEPFAIDISNRDRYYGIRYEITMYYTHIGYSILSGDGHCENIPSGFQAFLLKVVNINTPPDPITEDNIDAIAKLETEGRRLLKQLAAANN